MKFSMKKKIDFSKPPLQLIILFHKKPKNHTDLPTMSSHGSYKQTFSLAPTDRHLVGQMIGKKGSTIKAMKSDSGVSSLSWNLAMSQFEITGRVGDVKKALILLGEKVEDLRERVSLFGERPRAYCREPEIAPKSVQISKPVTNRYSRLDGLEEKLQAKQAEARRLVEEDADLDAAWGGMVKSAAIKKKSKAVVDSELAYGGSFVKAKKVKKAKKETKAKEGVTQVPIEHDGPSQFVMDSKERSADAWVHHNDERAKQQLAWEERQRKRKEKARKREIERQAKLERV